MCVYFMSQVFFGRWRMSCECFFFIHLRNQTHFSVKSLAVLHFASTKTNKAFTGCVRQVNYSMLLSEVPK